MQVTTTMKISRVAFSPEDGEEIDADLEIEVSGRFYRGHLEDWDTPTYVGRLSESENDRACMALYEAYEGRC